MTNLTPLIMRILLLVFTLVTTRALAQTLFIAQLAQHRETYKKELLDSAGGPLKEKADLAYIHFYEPDSTYRVIAAVERTVNAEPFAMPTYSGKTKEHVAYAVLSFVLDGKPQQLTLYRSLNLIKVPNYRDYLFLPFKDATSGEETYGGGRYIDFRTGDIKDSKLTLDFNRAYNPYCAYQEGYSCPIPPRNNVLSVPIEAGEKTYGKAH